MSGPPIESHPPGTPIAPPANTTAAALWILDHVVDREINKLRIAWVAGRDGRESVKKIECALRIAAHHAAGTASIRESRQLVANDPSVSTEPDRPSLLDQLGLRETSLTPRPSEP